jgi:hypothetical protein
MRISNPYGWLVTQVRALSQTINARELLTAFDNLQQTLSELLEYVSRYGNTTTQHKVAQLQHEIKAVRRVPRHHGPHGVAFAGVAGETGQAAGRGAGSRTENSRTGSTGAQAHAYEKRGAGQGEADLGG